MLKVIAIFISGAIVVGVAYVWWLSSRYGSAFERTAVGAAEGDLRAVAGPPSYETDGTRWIEPQHEKSPDQIVPGCVKELWYAMPWPLSQQFSFCFDRNGMLLHKYNWVSW